MKKNEIRVIRVIQVTRYHLQWRQHLSNAESTIRIILRLSFLLISFKTEEILIFAITLSGVFIVLASQFLLAPLTNRKVW